MTSRNKMEKKLNTHKGFSLVQLLLSITIIVLTISGVIVMAKKSSAMAALKTEQDSINKMVPTIIGAYASAPDFSTISTETVAGILNIPVQKMTGDSSGSGQAGVNKPNSADAQTSTSSSLPNAFKGSLTIRPATSLNTNDSFELVYSGLSTSECLAFTKSVSNRTQGIEIDNQSVQDLSGKIRDESQIGVQCGTSKSNTVALKFYTNKANFTATTLASCVCSPTTESQTLACPSNQQGSLVQTRTGLCTGGTASCRSLAWGSWVTQSNTCVNQAGALTPKSSTEALEINSCTPSIEQRSEACSAGQVGNIFSQRTKSCPSGTWSGWTVVQNTCVTQVSSTPCTPSTQTQTVACGAGQGGQIVQQRTTSCSATGSAVYGNWTTISNTCSASCAVTGNCCRVEKQNKTITRNCGVNNYGLLTVPQFRTSVCSSPTATSFWQSWQDITPSITGTCTSCPSPVTETDSRTVVRATSCSAGQTGTHTWTSYQTRTRVKSYNCTSGTDVTLPAPDYTAWGAWTENSRSNEVNTCSTPSTNSCFNENYSTSVVSGGNGVYGISKTTQGVNKSATCVEGTGCSSSTVTSSIGQSYGTWKSSCATGDTWSETNIPFGYTTNDMVTGNYLNTTCGSCNMCVLPNPSTQTNTDTRVNQQTLNCQAGYLGQIVQERNEYRTQSRDASCPNPVGSYSWGSWSSWSAWTPSTSWTTVSNTCAIACVAPNPVSISVTRSVSNENQTTGCPAGYTGSITQTRTRSENGTQTTTYDCPAPTGSYTSSTTTNWLGTYNYGSWTTVSNTCAAACVAPNPVSISVTRSASNENQTIGCPAGYTGSITQTRTRTENGTQTTTYDCPAPTGSYTSSTTTNWLGTYNYGSWTTVSNTCASLGPKCVTDPISQWVGRSGSCPAGYTGTQTWDVLQTRTSVCYSEYGSPTNSAWTDTSNTRNLNQTGCASLGPACNLQYETYSYAGGSEESSSWNCEPGPKAYFCGEIKAGQGINGIPAISTDGCYYLENNKLYWMTGGSETSYSSRQHKTEIVYGCKMNLPGSYTTNNGETWNGVWSDTWYSSDNNCSASSFGTLVSTCAPSVNDYYYNDFNSFKNYYKSKCP